MKVVCIKYILFLIFLSQFSKATAQTYFTFQREIHGFGSDTPCRNSCETFDGGCVMVGSSRLSAAETYVYVIKVDSMANVIWTILYDEGNGGGYSTGYDIEQTKDSGFVITGFVGGSPNCFVSKISMNGMIEWTNYYFIGYFYNHSVGVSVTQDLSNNYLILGHVDTTLSNQKRSYLMKTDSIGHTKWVKILSYDSSMNTTLNEIKISKDGNYLLSGIVSVPGATGGDPCLIKMDTSGDVLWSKKFILTNKFNRASVRESSVDSNISIAAVNGAIQYTGALLKLNPLGDTIWTKSYDSYLNAFEITDDNKYLLGGKQSTPGLFEMNLTKTDSSGHIEWSKSYCAAGHGWITNVHKSRYISGYLYNTSYELYLIRTDPDGNNCLYNSEAVSVVSGGSTVIDSSLPTGYFTLTTDSILTIYPQYHFQVFGGCSSYITNNIEESSQLDFTVSPNPFNDKLNISLPAAQNQSVLLRIFNSGGEIVLQKNIIGNYQELGVSTLSAGIYLLSIQNDSEISSKKILKIN